MAYSASNPPRRIAHSRDGATPSLWSYVSTDDSAVVGASGYFTGADNIGLRVGDAIIVAESDEVYAGAMHIVSSITSGTATAPASVMVDDNTFTCAISDAATGGNDSPTVPTASYIRVGQLCTVFIRAVNIDTTGMTAGNDLYFTGLPFTVSANSFGGGNINANDLTFTGQIQPTPTGSDTVFRIAETASAAAIDYIIVSQVSTGVTDLYINFSYIINAGE